MKRITDLSRFPPTVIGSVKFKDGWELETLDPQTERNIEITDGGEMTFLGGGKVNQS